MSTPGAQDEKKMRLRFAGECRVCGSALPAKTEAIYERATKTVRCVSHEAAPASTPEAAIAIDPGSPGASARREFERRKAARERRLRQKHPVVGGLLHAFSEEPQSTRAWDTGARGEEQLGRRLNDLGSGTLRVLHDRCVPGSRANIDHLAVTPSGVYVIDTKRYRGRPQLKVEGGLLRPRVEKLIVGRRDCTKAVDGVLRQVDVVRGVLDGGFSVHGILCFVEADWPLIGGSFTMRGVEVLWPKKLYARLQTHGPSSIDSIANIQRRLASALRPA